MKAIKLIVYPPTGEPIEHAGKPPGNHIEVVADDEARAIKITVENTTIKYVGLPYQLQVSKHEPGKEKW